MAVSMLPSTVISAAASAAYSVLLQPAVDGQLGYAASSSGDTAIYSSKNSSYGSNFLVRYSDGTAKAVSNTYDFINPFSYDGYAVACKNGKYGIINAAGNEVIVCQYNSYIDLAPDGALAVIEKSDTTYSVLDITKKTLSEVNLGNSAYYVSCGGGYLRAIQYDQNYDPQYYQYLTTAGQPAFGKTYQYASTFSHGYAVVKTVWQDVYQIINTQGNAVATIGTYGWYGLVGDNSLISVVDENGKYGYIDLSGKVVIQPQYDGANNFHNGYAVVNKGTYPNDSVGLIDTAGNIVIPFGQYESLTDASSTGLVWAVDKNNRTYVLKIGGSDQPSKPGTPQFTDVSSGAYYYDAVQWAVEKDIAAGTSTSTFSPNKTCSQVEILTFLWRAAEKPDSTAQLPFTPKNSWAAGALRWAYEKGMITASFNENEACTRSTAVKFIWQAADSPSAASSSFTDVSADANYAQAVDWAVANGVTSGTGNNTFSPDKTCTRAEIVTFLHRDRVAKP